ncbi:MAG: hypothetical protein GOU97_03435 [Nanoarchaeota archaeon]|nr:hypothetical protein [Nanoarchaeota archaeon]
MSSTYKSRGVLLAGGPRVLSGMRIKTDYRVTLKKLARTSLIKNLKDLRDFYLSVPYGCDSCRLDCPGIIKSLKLPPNVDCHWNDPYYTKGKSYGGTGYCETWIPRPYPKVYYKDFKKPKQVKQAYEKACGR